MFQKTSALRLPVTLNPSKQAAVFAVLSVAAFLIPFSLGHPQWLVGIIVNACLFFSAIFLPKKFFLPLVIFPSIGVLARGLLFGPLTPFLFYFLPFIWLGNLALILVFKKFLSRFNYPVSAFFASAAKFLLLFATAGVYLKFSLVPEVFLKLMGLNQFLTALAGGVISCIIFKSYAKRNSGS